MHVVGADFEASSNLEARLYHGPRLDEPVRDGHTEAQSLGRGMRVCLLRSACGILTHVTDLMIQLGK